MDLAPQGSAAAATDRRRWSSARRVVACLVVWLLLAAPYRPSELSPAGLLRFPLEAVALVALLLVVPRRALKPFALLVGFLLAADTVLKLLELGFRFALDRPFDAVTDVGYADSTVSLLRDSIGTTGMAASLAGAALLVLALVVGLPFAVASIGELVRGHRRAAAGATVVGVAVWGALSATGATLGAGSVASSSAVDLAVAQPERFRDSVADEREFVAQLETDPLARTVPQTLSGLRGKDVLLVFVESYGRYALESPLADGLRAELDDASRKLREAGFGSRSAMLTSPTFGGTSWLAHATLQSGLWVDSERRYERLLESRRTTLMGLFREEGWRTVYSIPSSPRPWTAGKELYRFHRMYGMDDFGYDGPIFGYTRVPDQYVLESLHRLELSRDERRPLMAEVDLATSHSPWAPLPDLVPWDALGDGDVYWPMALSGDTPSEVWADTTRLRQAYLQSISYSLRTVVQFLLRYGDEDTVVVLLGDHQPISLVSGTEASHDVPISIVAKDPAVLRAVAGWDWGPGLRPGAEAPLWRMDDFRGRFLDAFSIPAGNGRAVGGAGPGREGR